MGTRVRAQAQMLRLIALAVLFFGLGVAALLPVGVEPASVGPAPVLAGGRTRTGMSSGPHQTYPRGAGEQAVDPDQWPGPAAALQALTVRMGTPGPYAPVDSPVRLQFSEPMDEASVDESFSMQPAVDGALSWPDSSTLVFEPAQPLAYRTAYRVAVAGRTEAGWLTTAGNFTFTTFWAPPVVPAPLTLTFDDCGTPEAIRGILDILAQRGLHAIFFPTGLCRDQYPWLVPTLVAAGHRVCNHTYSHPDLTRLSDAAVASEIQRGVSVNCDLFRPPYGALDRSGRIVRIAASLGYRIQLWDVDTRDWAGTPADVMVAMIHARGGVVLFHMHGIHTLEALTKL